MVYLLEHLFRVVWHEEVVPKEWREGLIVNNYVRKVIRKNQVITGALRY